MSNASVKVRLLFVDDGEYHNETVDIPAASIAKYDRLIDCLREDSDVLARMYVDVDRLVSACVKDD
jgi:hypothetical protein